MSRVREELERIRDLPDDELAQALDRAKDELFRLRLGHYTQQVENPLALRDKRRELARIHTILNSRSVGREVQTTKSAAGKES